MDIHYSGNQSFRKYKINEDFIPNFLVELYFNFATPVSGSGKLYQKFFVFECSEKFFFFQIMEPKRSQGFFKNYFCSNTVRTWTEHCRGKRQFAEACVLLWAPK